jgi:hypothetical protein
MSRTSEKVGANAKQIGGGHYKKYPIEPWDYNIANNLPFMEGSIISYVTRWRDKGGVQDLQKCIHFLEKMIEVENGKVKEQPDKFANTIAPGVIAA